MDDASATERGFTVRECVRHELAAALTVQHEGFSRVADMLNIPRDVLPPLRETTQDLESLYDDGMRFFVAVDAKGSIIGTVRALDTDGTVEIGRLAVAGGWERRGVASSLMEALEAGYPNAHAFILFTGADAVAPLSLYRKLGYQETRREDLGHVELVWLEKQVGDGRNVSSAR